jgi:anti-sigma factor RsiW
MNNGWTEEQIAAWVDGSLAPDEAARIADVVANDPAALRTAEAIERQNAALRAAYAATFAEPTPARLTATVRGGPALAASSPRMARSRPAWAPMALAAGLALTIGLGAGAGLVGRSQGDAPAASGPAALAVGPADRSVAAALESSASGIDGAITPLATFRVATGGWCREFETIVGSGVACRTGDGEWSVVAAAVRPPSAVDGDGSYMPASGDFADVLGAALDALGAGAAVDPDAEAEAMARNWR